MNLRYRSDYNGKVKIECTVHCESRYTMWRVSLVYNLLPALHTKGPTAFFESVNFSQWRHPNFYLTDFYVMTLGTRFTPINQLPRDWILSNRAWYRALQPSISCQEISPKQQGLFTGFTSINQLTRDTLQAAEPGRGFTPINQLQLARGTRTHAAEPGTWHKPISPLPEDWI